MSNAEFKSKVLQGLDPAKPVQGGVRANSIMRWAPVAAAMRAQDTVPATSRRILCDYGLNGSDVWHVPDGTADPGGGAGSGSPQNYPDEDWRTVASQLARLTPGCMLEAHVMHIGAGVVVRQFGGGYGPIGAWGDVRVGVTWTSEDGLSTTGPHYFGFGMEGSGEGDYGGGENDDGAEDWHDIRERLIQAIRPPTFATDPDVAVAYSEWADVAITIELRGAPRIVHMVVYEMPLLHVTEHDDVGAVSVHAMPDGGSPLTPRPMVKAHDGTSFEENRFGTTRLLNVLAQQGERLGPRIFHLDAWDESANEWDQTEATPFAITSATNVDIYDSSISTWSEDNAGFIVGASHAQLHRLCDPNMIMRGEAAVVPARVRVDASQSSGTGTVRVQTGPYEWIEVSITGTRAIYEMSGYLEAQVHADHAWAVAQIFGRRTAGTLSIYSVSVDFGTA